MKKTEQVFIAEVKEVLKQNITPMEKVEALASIHHPNSDEVNLNTKLLLSEIEALEFERKDGALDRAFDSDEDYEKAETAIASNIVKNIKQYMRDLEQENFYHYQYSISLVYSSLKDGNYTYSSIDRHIDATSQEEAEKIRSEIKSGAPKEHPKEPGFTLEDVRIGEEVVDSKGQRIRAE